MICDSGTPLSVCSATLGICASGAFVAGGVAGALLNRSMILPGVALQVSAFVMPSLFEKLGLIQSTDDYYKKKREIELQKYGKYPSYGGSGTGNPQITYF